MLPPTAHVDTFARDNLPAAGDLPQTFFPLPSLQFPDRVNCVTRILERHIAEGRAETTAIIAPGATWTYADLNAHANRIARVLVEDFGIVPGNRVLLRSPNNPMLAACWFAVLKAGAVVVATMPLLRARDLVPIISKARINLALCDRRLLQELEQARAETSPFPVVQFDGANAEATGADLNLRMRAKPDSFSTVDTARDDVALIAFTSGTTGVPKGTLHYHADVLAMNATVGAYIFKLQPGDVMIGSPPLAFTFGLGSLLTFPLSAGASTVLLESASAPDLLQGIKRYQATVCATAPTAYRAMLRQMEGLTLPSLRRCISAGEHLPLETFEHWREQTGINIINGLGTTEMLHMFIGAEGADIRPGSTGRALPGYEIRILGPDDAPLPAGKPGRLAVRGPTGCKYMADPRQRDYVVNGWNLTGDICSMDVDGYVWYESRADDMIVSSGYNISGPEVEEALLPHPAVLECAVVAAPDRERGHVVKAFIVPAPGYTAGPDLTRTLQELVKGSIAPYKYPRLIEYVDALPKTYTGKLQRNVLRARAAESRQ